tara:strand:+ start:641 stop:1099 length:459 start_codon:yes stop_codon:yes gene_type:complete
MILNSTAKSIQILLQKSVNAAIGRGNNVPVYVSDTDITKDAMPYIIIDCTSSEEQITPGCGIFKVEGNLEFRSHSKDTTPAIRERVLKAINNFAYDSTAVKLSTLKKFHCHGWHPTTGKMDADNDRKAMIYTMTYWVYCMELDEVGDNTLPL